MVENFRIEKVELNMKMFKDVEIRLMNKYSRFDQSNHYSLIVGNNGTGKSVFLSEVAKYFIDKKIRKKISIGCNQQPRKIIAISNTISDKFPMDDSYRMNFKNRFRESYENFEYVYLGLKSRNSMVSVKTQMKRAIDIVIGNYYKSDNAVEFRAIFEYLNYRPIIKMTYKMKGYKKLLRDIDNIGTNHLKEEHLYELLEKHTSNGFNNRSIQERLDNYDLHLYEVLDFINQNLRQLEYYDGVFEFAINFSEKNIMRNTSDFSNYNDIFKQYNILEFLRNSRLLSSYDIKVYKIEGEEVNFTEASSGEANIMSTFLSLIPLIEDNSLILIDEPEISLHPFWQYKYLELLNSVLDRVKGCHILIASHSHFLISDLEPDKSSVIVLKKSRHGVEVNLLENATYGWSAEDILLNIFELPSTRNYYLSQLVSEALVLYKDNQSHSTEFKKIKSKLLNIYPIMKEEDPLKSVVNIIVGDMKND